MEPSQQPTVKLFSFASSRRRLISGVVFLSIAGAFAGLWLIGHYKFTLYPFACGFKQRFGLPCPTCGMTTAVLAFAQGRIIDSFYAHPAAAIFCCLAVITAFFAFLSAVFGIYSPLLEKRLASVKPVYIIVAVVLVLLVGWGVNLARTLAIK
jgi:hypothetical protein